MRDKLLIGIGAILIVIALIKPDISGIITPRPFTNDSIDLMTPVDESVLKEAKDVLSLVKQYNISKQEARRLRDLYLDIGQLVKLDGDDEVIKNTEEIRQVNSIAGPMLKLDIKGKYPNLAKEAKEVIVAAIGDDNIVLSPDLRVKAVDGFNALAWAYNEASK